MYQSTPRRITVRQPLSATESAFHLIMTLSTAGLWWPIWQARKRSRRIVTTIE